MTNTVLEELMDGKILQLEWVHQQYLSDCDSLPEDHPWYPDQMKGGEGESITGLKLEMDKCKEPPCQVKVWVEYLSSVRFPDRKPFKPGLDVLYQNNTPPDALIFPEIEDTRYSDPEIHTNTFSIGSMNRIPIMVDIVKGIDSAILSEDHFLGPNEQLASFNRSSLQSFLLSLWQQKWLAKEHYQVVNRKEELQKISFLIFARNILLGPLP